jgi:hypothetical protein
MTTPGNQAPSRTRWRCLGRFLFAERAAPVWLACTLLALELIPIYAWLVILAVYGGGADGQAAIPLWLLTFATLGYWQIGARSAGGRRILGALGAIALGVCASLLAIALASLSNAPVNLSDLSWLTGLGEDLVANGPSASRALLIVAILIWLGWRALSIGRRLPDVNGAKIRFAYSFGALLLGTVTIVGLPDALRPPVAGWLSLLLPADAFVGLLATSLARRREAQRARAESSQIDGVRWMGAALILSGLVVLIALALGALVNLDGVSLLLAHLGPVGQALSNALNGALLLVERALSALFDAPLQWLQDAARQAGGTTRRPLQTGAPTRGPRSADLGRWQFLSIAVMSVFVSLVLIVLALAFMRLLRRDDEAPPDGPIDEERTTLDASALWREQMRDLLGRFQRGPRAAPDVLPAGSVRSLYRDILAAASSHGIGRLKAETPDEFAARLAGAVGDSSEQSDVAALTDAYDTARYGEREPERAQFGALRSAAQRLVRRISAR